MSKSLLAWNSFFFVTHSPLVGCNQPTEYFHSGFSWASNYCGNIGAEYVVGHAAVDTLGIVDVRQSFDNFVV